MLGLCPHHPGHTDVRGTVRAVGHLSLIRPRDVGETNRTAVIHLSDREPLPSVVDRASPLVDDPLWEP